MRHRALSRRALRYARRLLYALARSRPRDVLRATARSPLVVKKLEPFGFAMVLDVRDPAISRPLLVLEEYEPHVTAALEQYFRPRTCFVDVGAGLGFFSLLAASRCPEGRITSFEPDPENLRLFRASLALNGWEDRVRVFPYAASDSDGTLFFSSLSCPENRGARFTAKTRQALAELGASEPPREVPAVALGPFLEKEPVHVVKVDVEGFEPFVFRGMADLLRRQRPVVVTEFAPGTIRHISRTDPEDLIRLWAELGYLAQALSPDGPPQPLGIPGPSLLEYCQGRGGHHVDLLLLPAP